MKKSFLLATSAIIASGVVATSAHAVDVELYGQVNKLVMGADLEGDGQSADINILDNDNSSTRFGMRGEQQLSHGLTASVLLEGQFQSNDSSKFNLAKNGAGATEDGDPASWTTRHTRVGLGGQWGALFMGRTATASDGITNIDLSEAKDVSNSAISRFGGAVKVGPNDEELSDLTDNIDGMGYGTGQHGADRANLVRFDTPSFQGLKGRVAYTQNQDVDASVRYNNTFAGVEVAGGASYVKFDGDTNDLTGSGSNAVADNAWSVTASAKHESGVSGTVNYGERNYDNLSGAADDPTAFYAKLGYKYNNTGFAIDYAKNDDSIAAFDDSESSEAEAYGAYVQQDLGHGVSTSAFYKQVQTEVGTNDGDDLDLFGVGMRVKF